MVCGCVYVPVTRCVCVYVHVARCVCMYVPVVGKLGPWHREISSYQLEGELHRWIYIRVGIVHT